MTMKPDSSDTQCCIDIPSSKSCLQQIELRSLRITDIPEMKLLCSDWFPIEYPDDWYVAITQKTSYITLAAVIESCIIGLVVAEVKRSSRCNPEDKDILNFLSRSKRNVDVAYILSVGVSNNYRRKGIASFLLDTLIDKLPGTAKAVYLHVMVGNEAAIQFYERSRFVQHRRLLYYYTIGSSSRDAYTYVRRLNQPQAPASAARGFAGAWASGGASVATALAQFVRRLVARLSALKPCMMPQRLVFSFHRVRGASE